ncbi:Phthiocerol/phenolphthiocerol synthesis polyketide synthase type I PpsE [Kordia antarctica]|uniref:Phthiocerol/phenolphthiocerol synthesis polyketide synthase type I PpsE n=1 Tax=Kordia antarctica TaxID=1218801 RepID=A0A7L4ZG16_9FLAO|nr:type I polyketide synthase [Kordia antarctica]QHI35407.1 Phthiocerol/phenolphthiocerol synthesis polyketide synthase type I PpsE [Kordia antarctica]
MEQTIRKKDIAIVGLSGKFHGSKDIREFWKNLEQGNELLKFYTEQELEAFGIDQSIINDPNYVPVNSIAAGIENFDYAFFGYTKDEAKVMDPQIRMLHELAWLALEDAGYPPSEYAKNIGVYLSASGNFEWLAHTAISSPKNVNPLTLSQLTNRDYISTLISYSLNLRGPSYFTSTACSSSLTSIHLACRSLLMRECSIALAGGVSIDCSDYKGYFYAEGMITSKDGHCKAFSNDSSGSVKGNGGAIIALKRMEDAVNDNDHIYAIIRSSAANNDGRRKVGYTAPSVSGQAECIMLAHKVANVPYNTISYIEAHGTATKLGDPIEIEALNKAFNNDVSHKCAIGSLKSNVGHLDAAAGVAGVIKTSLALKNKKIPASLHYAGPNPEINFASGPFYVNDALSNWKPINGTPLRAGVSSFGIGGTNAHVVLEAYDSVNKKSSERPYVFMPFSAKTQTALDNYTQDFKDFLKDYQDTNLADLSHTLQTGRTSFNYRNFALYKNTGETLEVSSIQNKNSGTIAKKNSTVVFMFPGQGNQYFAMAKDLYSSEPLFKEVMDEGFKVLLDITGESYKDILGYNETAVDENKINNTLYTQPILFLVEYALASYLLKLGITPKNMIGHSLGEYTAACIANVFSLKDGLKLITKRAKLISNIEEGTMVAVGVSSSSINSMLDDSLSIAAINTPDSCIISGNDSNITAFTELLTQKEISFSILKTSHAFHSEMMDAMLGDFEKEFQHITLSEPTLPFVSNLTGKPITKEEATSGKYWVRHLRETVRFADGLNHLLKKSNTVFIEVGPGKSMRSFYKQLSKDTKYTNVGLMRHPKEQFDDSLYFTDALATLWSAGIKIDWEVYYAHEVRYKISAPTYSFDKHKFEVEVDVQKSIMNHSSMNNGMLTHDEWYHERKWKTALLPTQKEVATISNYLVFSDQNALIAQLIPSLTTEGNKVIEVTKGEAFIKISDTKFTIRSNSKEDLSHLFDVLKQGKNHFDAIIYNWKLQGELQDEIVQTFTTVLKTCKELIATDSQQQKKIVILSDFNYDILGNEHLNIAADTISMITNVCAQENKNITALHIDIAQEKVNERLINDIKNELSYNTTSGTIAFRNNRRWVDFYDRISIDSWETKPVIEKGKTYLITGGLGYLGNLLTKHILETYKATVILTGRSPLPEAANALEHPKFKKLQKLQEIHHAVHYYQMDVSDEISVNQTIETITQNHGEISGIIHAAGNIDNNTFKFVESIDEKSTLEQFAPKINGTLNLYKTFKNKELDFVWISSSLASILGGLSYGAYAVANRFIDAFLQHHKEELKHWTSINFDGLGVGAIESKEIVAIFEKTHHQTNFQQYIISRRDPNLVLLHASQETTQEAEMETEEVLQIRDTSNYVAPSSETEKTLSDIWQSFFGYDKIGITEDFFELGGDSLKAMTLIKRMHKFYGVELNLLDFFSKPNIKELAGEIDIALKIINDEQKKARTNVIKI